MDLDIGDTIAPDSDQLDAIDLRSSGPQTFTVTRVVVKRGDQPVDVHLKEFPRPWRPGKSMRRVLDQLWGPSADGAYEGRRVTLFCDTRVKFGGEEVGGVRVSHMSHIGGKRREVVLIVGKGRVGTYKVDPLPDEDRAASASQRQDTAGITPTHEQQIRAHMKRAKIDSARVLELAKQAAGRDVTSARDLSAVEADALLVLLADLPDGEA